MQLVDHLENDDAHQSKHFGLLCLAPFAKAFKSRFAGPAFLNRLSAVGPDVEFGRYVGINEATYVCRATIGNYCSFGARNAINPFSHPTDWLSTHEFQYHTRSFGWVEEYAELDRLPRDAAMARRVEIGSDVWTGHNVCVMPGVTIGTGAIVGGGAVVTHDVPPYAIVAGVPAKILRFRFKFNLREKLLASEWWDLELPMLSGLPFQDVERCIEMIEERKKSCAS